jgi:HlyD family secretion protein
VARARSTQAAAQAQVADATARRELAASTPKRNQDLAAQNFISAGALEGRLQEKASADAALQAAQANLSGTAQDINRKRPNAPHWQQQRGNVRLLAPADAVVTSRDAEAGSTVVAGQPVLRLIDPASLWVQAAGGPGPLGGLAPGLKASIVLRSQPQLRCRARWPGWRLLADSVTEERIAQVAFAAARRHPPMAASVGELAEVDAATARDRAQPCCCPMPASSACKGRPVCGAAGGQTRFAPVRLGASSLDGRVQVLEGLKAGDSVVVYSQKALTAGARVQVVDALVKAPRSAP